MPVTRYRRKGKRASGRRCDRRELVNASVARRGVVDGCDLKLMYTNLGIHTVRLHPVTSRSNYGARQLRIESLHPCIVDERNIQTVRNGKWKRGT